MSAAAWIRTVGFAMNGDDTNAQLMNVLVRMVVPMRREFGRQLNVGQFLHDFAYAREVLDEALRSQDARLLEYARYVESCLHGPRLADASGASGSRSAQGASESAASKELAAKDAKEAAARDSSGKDVAAKSEAAAPAAPLSAEEMRARIMKKYTDGLR